MVNPEKADKITEIVVKNLMQSIDFKEPRMSRISTYEDAYLTKTKRQNREQFNTPNLVFSGMVDGLESDLDQDIRLRFKEQNPADYNSVKKLNPAWEEDSSQLTPNAMWDRKLRMDRHNNIMCGVSIQKTFAHNNPSYESVFDILKYRSFHAEPKGGPILERHMFCGEQDIFKTQEEIEDGATSNYYSPEQVDKIRNFDGFDDEKKEFNAKTSQLNKFNALDMNADTNNYVGQKIFNICEFMQMYEGTRYHVIFDPWTQEWLRVVPWKEDFKSNLLCWTSWASFEDDTLFWSKSYADMIYPVGEAVKNLLDQELTNRQKRNLGAKLYDEKMFPDVAKLDAAQYRPDALVPVRVPEGKSAADGLFEIVTPELQGTIQLISWVEQDLGKHAGETEMTNNNLQKGAKLNVQYTMLQQAQKRLTFKSKSVNECFQQIGQLWLQGLVEHLDKKISIRMGIDWDELTRKDLKFKKPLKVKIISQTEEDKLNALGKEQKMQAVKTIIADPDLMKQNNPKVLTEWIWRDVGGLNDDTIASVMDTQSYGPKNELAEADKAIEMLRQGKKPEIYFDATTAFLRRIHRWERAHQNELKPKITKMFQEYIDAEMQIVQENMQYIAQQAKLQQTIAAANQPSDGQPQQKPVPARQPAGRMPLKQKA